MNHEDENLDNGMTEDYKNMLSRFTNMPTNNYGRYYKPLKTSKQGGYNAGGSSNNFREEEIRRWLQNPQSNEKQLRDLSTYLYNANSLYKWFINVLSGMPTWNWVLSMDTYGVKKKQKQLEQMYRLGAQWANLRYSQAELNKIFKTIIKEDWYYGYEVETDDSYFIMKLDPQYCRVSSIFEDGIRAFQFDFSFFDNKESIDQTKVSPVIQSYPEEFRKGYAYYQRTGNKWVQLDPINTVCWKLNDDLDYGLPYFINMATDLSDIGFYKALSKDRAEIDNFLVLHQKIPVDENTVDKFAISSDLARGFDALAAQAVPESVSVITSPMDVTAVKTERGTSEKSNIKDSTTQAFTGAGMPEQLANATTSTGLGQAIKANENIVYRFYKQVEKTYNFKMRYKFPSIKMKTRILELTYFSREEKTKELLTGAQSGLVPPSHVASAQGSNPYEFLNDIDLENNILGVTMKLKPLQTSHTMSGNNSNQSGSGRPPESDTKIADSTTVTRDTDANENRA